jgi:hypothetical protein
MIKPSPMVVKSVVFTLLALTLVNRVNAAQPVKKLIYGQ